MDVDEPYIVLTALAIIALAIWKPNIAQEVAMRIRKSILWIIEGLRDMIWKLLKFLFWFVQQFLLSLGDFFVAWWERLKQGPP